MSRLDLLLVYLENEYFREKFESLNSLNRMIGEKLHHVFLLLYILVVSVGLIRYQGK